MWPGRESVDIARYKNSCQDDTQHNYPEGKHQEPTVRVCLANLGANYQALINNYSPELGVINYSEIWRNRGEMIVTCAGEAVAGVRGALPLQQADDYEHHEDEHEEGHGEADVEREVGGLYLVTRALVLITIEDGEVVA